MPMKRSKRPHQASTQTVSFRLPPDDLSRLEAQAKAFDTGRNYLARYYVREALADPELRTALARRVEVIHKDLAQSVLALLVQAGNVPPDEAQAWVAKNLSLNCLDS